MKCPSKNYQCGRGFFRSISGHELNPTPNWSRLVGSDLIQGHPRSTYSIDIYIYNNIYIPGTQLTPVLIGKGHIWGGWWSKIEVIQVLDIRIIYIYI